MPEILIDKIIRSKRKTLALQIEPDSKLIVRAPQMVSEEVIFRFVDKKRSWILDKQRVALEVYRPQIRKEFINGEGFLYLGEIYKLFLVDDDDEPLLFNGHEFKLSGQFTFKAKELFTAWYKREAYDVITKRVARYADMAELSNYRKISITDAKNRWGSCGHKGTLNFSWRLIMAPIKIVDYVVTHELAHLRERHHSQRFWNVVRSVMPDYKQHREWLRDNHRLLNI